MKRPPIVRESKTGSLSDEDDHVRDAFLRGLHLLLVAFERGVSGLQRATTLSEAIDMTGHLMWCWMSKIT